jgi:hypothetical protein
MLARMAPDLTNVNLMWLRCITDDRNIVIYIYIQCNSIIWVIVIDMYYLMMAPQAETRSKIVPLINPFAQVV